VTSGWLFDPDGTLLEGPQGPVSHLICGGVYDWSTGLLYQGGRYFDPALGIWLALMPLVVVQSLRGRKRRQRGYPWLALLLVGVCVSGLLTACRKGKCPPLEATPSLCTHLDPATPQIRSFDATLGEIDASDVWGPGKYEIHLGRPDKAGIVFDATVGVPSGATGSLEFVQVGNIDRRWVLEDGTVYAVISGRWALDKSDPYPGGTSYVDSSGTVQVATNDSPGISIGYFGIPNTRDNPITKMEVRESYEMYLVWRPGGGTGENRVVLGVIDWGWSGKAEKRSDGSWSLLSRPDDRCAQSWRCATEIRSHTGILQELGPARLYNK
jgi:hypothetical protein